MPWSYWPDDFIPQYNAIKSTVDDPTPVDDRFKLMDKALVKRTAANQGTTSGISMVDFVLKLQSLRLAVIKYGAIVAEKYLVTQVNSKFPGLEVAGRAIQTSADLVEFYKKGPNDCKMREIIDFATNCWGDNNQWAINGEQDFCNRFLIKFTGAKSNGKTTAKVHKGRCVAQLFVARKGAIVEKIRNTGKKNYFEAIYRRGEKAKIGLSGSDSKGVPRLLKQIKVTVATHGFNGKLGICDGHPETNQIKEEQQPSVVVARDSSESQISELSMAMTPAPTVTRQSEFQEWFSMNIGNYETKADVLSALLLENLEAGPLLDSPTVVTRDAASVERDDEFLSTGSPRDFGTPTRERDDEFLSTGSPRDFGTPTVAPSEQGENVLPSATSPSRLNTVVHPNTLPVVANVQNGVADKVSKSILFINYFDWPFSNFQVTNPPRTGRIG